LKLYDLDISGNCHKVRLFLSILGKEPELVPVDFMGGEHKRPPITDLNPFGELPILVDGDVVIRDSQVILIYLARKFNATGWLPIEAEEMARVLEWLAVAENEIARGPNDARLAQRFDYKLDAEAAREKSDRVLTIMDAHLADNEWLALGRATLADIACYPYLAVASEGGVNVSSYPHVSAWMKRVEALPGFVPMPAG
jgi:glutathione S-transferase